MLITLMNIKKSIDLCPCGSQQKYAICCQPAHQGIPAKTAEALMRSRYSAFVLGLQDYLLASWHSSTRPLKEDLHLNKKAKWLGLKIIETTKGQEGDVIGTVKFIARYKINGKATRIEENSEFVFENGRWYYTIGT